MKEKTQKSEHYSIIFDRRTTSCLRSHQFINLNTPAPSHSQTNPKEKQLILNHIFNNLKSKYRILGVVGVVGRLEFGEGGLDVRRVLGIEVERRVEAL